MARPQRSGEGGFLRRIAGGASERVLDIVDPNVVLDHVDVDLLLDRIDVNALLDRVEINQLLDRVDINELLDKVDLNQLLDKVDVDALLGRADIDALMERVDIKALVERAGIPAIVAESTTHLTGSALDLFRRPLVGLDEVIFRGANRVIGRDPREFPQGPAELVTWVDDRVDEKTGVKTGRYAGPLTRLLAAIIDGFFLTVSFTLIVGGLEFIIQLFAPGYELPSDRGLAYAITLAAWGLVYLVASVAIFGKTVGKAVLGLRVVTWEGNPGLHKKEPLMRALTFPLSFILALGLFGIVWGRERRAWHDHLAGTAVVYDWGSRTASLPTPLAKYLERREEKAQPEPVAE
jgi:uncharacterized RDD family membrane protein YckC